MPCPCYVKIYMFGVKELRDPKISEVNAATRCTKNALQDEDGHTVKVQNLSRRVKYDVISGIREQVSERQCKTIHAKNVCTTHTVTAHGGGGEAFYQRSSAIQFLTSFVMLHIEFTSMGQFKG